MGGYSAWSPIRNPLTGLRHRPRARRDPAPKPRYDVLIVDGGGRGLAAAHCLAKPHGVADVAVPEKGVIGAGNAGRNMTIIRSICLLPGNQPFYEWSMKLWEGLERDLNFNVMVSQRGDIDGCNSYAQLGNLPTVVDVCEDGMAPMPMTGRLRAPRHWGGVVEMSMDGSPIIDRTPVEGLYLNAGWRYGGFKAKPAPGWRFAHLIARDEPRPLAAAYRLDRFASGRVIDEKGAGAQPNLH